MAFPMPAQPRVVDAWLPVNQKVSVVFTVDDCLAVYDVRNPLINKETAKLARILQKAFSGNVREGFHNTVVLETHSMNSIKSYAAGLALAIAALGLAPSAVQAAVLNVVGGQLMGASDVDVGGTLYDVSFQDGTCSALFSGCDGPSDFVFNTQAMATSAVQALLGQVLLDTGAGDFDTVPGLTSGCSADGLCNIIVPYAAWELAGFRSVLAENYGPPPPLDQFEDALPQNRLFDTGGSLFQTFAVFQLSSSKPAEVPEPAALLLFGVGLAGLAGFARCRQDA